MTAKVINLVCERACDLSAHVDAEGRLKGIDGAYVVKYPCSGMIQPLQIEAALKAGAEGVVVHGCQIGDCYFREGNKMIRDRLLGERPPGLKKAVDRRRVIGLWLSRVQTARYISEVKEFVRYLGTLEAPAAAAAPAAKPAAAPPKTDTTESK
jgi:coenzyme F420-reducing hydrogenase delta subunit